MNTTDLLADLPAPDDSEPPSLRSDIADELLDHLQCAYRREVLKDGDETAAEERVLDRFGDPRKLARRLWWQAMWSRVMGKKLLSGLQWLATLAVVCLAIVVLRQQSEILTELNAGRAADANWRSNLTMTLNELRNRLPVQTGSTGAAMTRGDQPTGGDSGSALLMPGSAAEIGLSRAAVRAPALTVKLVYESADGPPVTDLVGEISLSGRRGTPLNQNGDSAAFPSIPGAMPAGGSFGPGLGMAAPLASDVGRYAFDGLDPDRYELQIQLHGQTGTHQVAIRDEQPQELTIICPRPRKKVPVHVAVPPLPGDLQQAGFTLLTYKIMEQPLMLGTTAWIPQAGLNIHNLKMDVATGQLERIEGNMTLDLRNAAEDNRFLFLPAGPIGVRCELSIDSSAATPVYDPPPKENADLPFATYLIKAGENRLELKYSEELLKAARVQIAVQGDSTYPADTADYPPASADENTLQDTYKLSADLVTLKLVLGDENGPPVTDAAVYIISSDRTLKLKQILPSASSQDDPISPSGTGVYRLADIKPDRYQLQIQLADGQHLQRSLLVRGDKPTKLTFVCPPPRKKIPVLLSAPALPEDLRKAGVTFHVQIWDRFVELKDAKWLNTGSKIQRVIFDARTGAVTNIGDPGGQMVDVSDSPPEDRAVFLSTGPANVVYTINIPADNFLIETLTWPPEDGKEVHQVEPNAERWELTLPDELLKSARERLKHRELSRSS